MITKLHAVTDENGRPIRFFMTVGQVSDYTGAAALLDTLPKAQWMLADRGYDADWFRGALQEKGIKCVRNRGSSDLLTLARSTLSRSGPIGKTAWLFDGLEANDGRQPMNARQLGKIMPQKLVEVIDRSRKHF